MMGGGGDEGRCVSAGQQGAGGERRRNRVCRREAGGCRVELNGRQACLTKVPAAGLCAGGEAGSSATLAGGWRHASPPAPPHRSCLRRRLCVPLQPTGFAPWRRRGTGPPWGPTGCGRGHGVGQGRRQAGERGCGVGERAGQRRGAAVTCCLFGSGLPRRSMSLHARTHARTTGVGPRQCPRLTSACPSWAGRARSSAAPRAPPCRCSTAGPGRRWQS